MSGRPALVRKPAHPGAQRIVNGTRRDQHIIIGSRTNYVPTALLDVKVGEYPDTHGRRLVRGVGDLYHLKLCCRGELAGGATLNWFTKT